MTPPRLSVTWFVAPAQTAHELIRAWCAATVSDVGDRFTLLEQVGDGRGQLSSGLGAAVIGPERFEAGDGWWTSSHTANFRLRSTSPPTSDPVPGNAPFLLLTRTYVPEPMRNEYREWLEQEHSQRQLTVPGNEWYLGYEEEGARHSFMNLWGLVEPDIAEGEAWDQARLTPWRERMRPAMADMDRAIYRPIR
jgi:hypothetical protein